MLPSSSWFLKLPYTSLKIKLFFVNPNSLLSRTEIKDLETLSNPSWNNCVCTANSETGKPALLNLCWINEKAVSLTKTSITFSLFSAFFTQHDGEFQIAIRIYRGVFLFVLVTFLLAVNTWGWRKAGVNHVLIFELDPRDHLSYQQLLEVMAYSW